MFRLHLNTLDSNVKFHYAILDNERDVVVQDSELHESKVAFGMLTHTGHPDDALNEPFMLVIFYEHEHEKNELGIPECPKIEIHLVVEPAHFHVESLECSPYELDLASNHILKKEYTFNHDFVSENTVVLPSFFLKE